MIYTVIQSLKIGILKAKKTTTILCFIVISSLGYTQQISKNNSNTVLYGIITNSQTQKPLYGVSIWIKELQRGVITDKKGRYTLKVPSGEYTITVSYVGFSKITEKSHIICHFIRKKKRERLVNSQNSRTFAPLSVQSLAGCRVPCYVVLGRQTI